MNENSAEQLACDPRYPAVDSGVAPPTSGTSSGGGTWSAVTNVSDNTLTYSPAAHWVGPDTYTMFFCNDVGCSGVGRLTATVNVTVAAPIISLTPTLSNGQVGVGYSQTLTASGGVSPYTFSVVAGALPPGVTLGTVSNPNGTSSTVPLAGTPTAGGTFNFTIRATDNSIGTGPVNKDQAYTVTISPPTISVTPTTVPSGANGTPYSQTLNASGGTAPYTWTQSAGTLPTGISLSSSGVLTGTPTQAGSFIFTARATDSSTGGGPYAGARAYNLVIAQVVPVAGVVSRTVAYSSTSNPITLNLTGGPPTSVAVASAASHGVATAAGTTITYTPTAGYAGPDSFTYTATNSAGTSGPATVTITVSPPTIALAPVSLPDGTTGAAYSQTITPSGGASPYAFTISAGALPTGLSINASTGVISGTPTATGTSNFTVQAQDSTTGPSAPFAGARAYTVNVAAPPVAITAPAAGALPAATGGVAYSQAFTASGGQTPHTFTLASGSLPAGVTLSSAGVLSGTPTVSGTFNFTATTTDSSPNPGPYTSSAVAYSLVVNPPTIAVGPTTLPAATAALAYSQTITATGGTTPHTFSVTAGTLPTGLTLSPAAALSGTPTATGTFNFTVTATDALGFTGAHAYSVVTANPVITLDSPSAGALPGATGGVAFSQTFTASGGQGTHSFAVTAGALPSGVALTGAGVLSGTPTVSGTFNFSVTATDTSPAPGPFNSAPVTYSLVVTAPPITVSPTTLPNATTAVAYSETLSATGGTAPHAFSITAGALPAGLSLSPAGALSSMPTAAGTFNFTVTATDALGFTGSRAYSVVTANPVVIIDSPSAGPLPGATGGTGYSQPLTASGGQPPHTFALASGSLPAGVTLSSGGVLSGTPTASGTFNFTLTASDSSSGPAGPFTSAPVAYSVTVAAPGITLAPSSLPNATTATAFSETLTASGGTGPYAFNLTAGTLPVGLSLISAGGVSGAPAAAGTFNFTVTATDALGFTGLQAYSIVVADPVITITSPSAGALTPATGGTAYNQTFAASGGQGSRSFGLVAGSLPPGMSFTSAGVLSGVPTAAGTFNFTLTASDASPGPGGPFASAPVAYSLTVGAPAIALAPGSLSTAITAVAYSEAITASGGTGPYAYSLTAGSLPPGLNFTSAGALSGAPTAAGTFNVTITATDAHGFTGGQAYSIPVVDPVISIATPAPGALPAATGGTAYNQTFTASGGQGPRNFALTAGSLPPGLSFTSAGVLSGTPTVAGTYNFTFMASDSSPGPGGPFMSAPAAYSLSVAAPTIVLAPSNLPAAATAQAYNATLSTTGGIAPYNYSLSAGALPPGFSLNSAGVISGAPTTAGTYIFTVEVTDALGFTGSQAYTVAIVDPAIAITAPAAGALPPAEAGMSYTAISFGASGGNGSYTFALSGGLPPGMSFTSAGLLSGTPASAGNFSFSITPTDTTPAGSGGPFSGAAAAYTLLVDADAQAPVFTSFPVNVTEEVDYPAATAVANWVAPVATDNQPGVTVTQTAGPASGSAFPLGTTTVSYEARDAAANATVKSFTVDVTQRQPGRVTIVVTSIIDGAFNFSSGEPSLNFTVNTASGSGTSGAVLVPAGSHRVAFTVPAGFDVASATCSDPASSFDPSARSGTLLVVPGGNFTCTISASDISQTTDLIGSFLEARGQLIVANGPDVGRRIERLTGGYTSQGGVSGFGLGFAEGGLPFAVRLSEHEATFQYSLRRSQAEDPVTSRIETAHSGGLADGRGLPSRGGTDNSPMVTALGSETPPAASPFDAIDGASPGVATDPTANPFDIWVEGKLARFSAAGGDGRFGIVHAGADYLVTPRLLFGLGAQLDWTHMDGDQGEIDGTGYLIGPYMTTRLTDRIFFDARAAWGRSSNTVSPFGTYSDELDATRWLVSAALIGRFDIEQWTIEPTARISYFEEESEAYKDSLGFDIPSISAATGTFEFGPRLSYRIELADEKMLEPFASLEGIWTFKQDNTATVVSESPGLAETGLRGRGEVGFSLSGQEGSALSASAFYDGIGGFDFESWGAQLRLSRSF